MAWAGPVSVYGALAHHQEFRDFRIDTATIEAQTAFDSFPGGRRNHDLLLTGVADGGRAVVSIESKADEEFGQTVRQYLVDAQKTRDRGEATNAPERLERLVSALIDHGSSADERVLDLRFQLLSGAAGAIAAAVDDAATSAVFFVHEFVTDETSAPLRRRNAQDLRNFATILFNVDLPDAADPPWCVGPLPFPGNATRLSPAVSLYLAKAATDWRTRSRV